MNCAIRRLRRGASLASETKWLFTDYQDGFLTPKRRLLVGVEQRRAVMTLVNAEVENLALRRHEASTPLTVYY